MCGIAYRAAKACDDGHLALDVHSRSLPELEGSFSRTFESRSAHDQGCAARGQVAPVRTPVTPWCQALGCTGQRTRGATDPVRVPLERSRRPILESRPKGGRLPRQRAVNLGGPVRSRPQDRLLSLRKRRVDQVRGAGRGNTAVLCGSGDDGGPGWTTPLSSRPRGLNQGLPGRDAHGPGATVELAPTPAARPLTDWRYGCPRPWRSSWR